MSNFWQRLITGVLFVTVLIGALLWSAYSTYFLFFLVSLIGLSEFYGITKSKKTQIAYWPTMTAGALVYLIVGSLRVFDFGGYLITLTIPVVSILLILELFREQKRPITNIAYAIFGILYISVPFALLNYIPSMYAESEHSRQILLAFFVCLWANDTGAYVVGRMLGRTKLFERISPKKTWEGFFGGMFFAVIAGYVFSEFVVEISLFNWIIFGILISSFGTLGDLVESMIKRNYNIKDSGNILPGHGGILDRFDGIFLACPIIFMYLEFISHLH